MKLKYAILFLAVFLFFPAAARAANGEEQINSFKATLTVHSDNTVTVKEEIVYNFGDYDKHGIFRNIPVVFTTNYGKLKTKISAVTVSNESGSPYKFSTSKSGNNLEIKIGDANTTASGIQTYVINYSIERVINFFEDHDELYWNITGNEWNVPILSAQAFVLLPGEVPQSSIKIKCFAGSFGSGQACQEAIAQTGGAGFSQQSLAANEGLTIVVVFPKGLVIPATTWQKVMQIFSDNWIAVVPLFIFIIFFWIWYSFGRDPEVSKIVVAEYEAPAGLSPAEIAQLLKFSEPVRGITGEIIFLAVNGYLKITAKKDDYELTKLKPPDGSEKKFQKTLLNGLFDQSTLSEVPGDGEGLKKLAKNLPAAAGFLNTLQKFVTKENPDPKNPNVVMLSSLEDSFYTKLIKAKSEIVKSLINQKYFTSDPAKVKVGFVVIAFFVGCLGFPLIGAFGLIGLVSMLVSAVIIIIFGLAMPRRTLSGALAAKQILGLKLYLEVAEKDRLEFHNAPSKTPERFEKLLPYAIALGVEKQWAKKFEGIYLSPPSWYSGNYSTFGALAFVNSIDRFHSTSSTTLASSPGSSASGGGSGFSGGSSGGGFGGGGGGSW